MDNKSKEAAEKSPPSRGAWIEILILSTIKFSEKSPPSRGAWIEIYDMPLLNGSLVSPPSRGAWIEIPLPCHWHRRSPVAPLAGGVD